MKHSARIAFVLNLLLVLITSSFISFFALADDSLANHPELLPPLWVESVILWLQTIPTVGPVVVQILKWVSVVSVVMTAASAFAQTVLMIPEIAARFAGAPELASKIKVISEKILYWLKMFSVFNARKPPK